jgi:hypothetical protein
MKYVFFMIVSTCPEHGPRPVGILAYSFPSFSKLRQAPFASVSMFFSID